MSSYSLDIPSPDVVRKYDVPGPRYTSYPTAADFGPITEDQWRQALVAEMARDPAGLSLYVHIPFCPSLCLYCGCNVEITHRPERVSRYVDQLVREIQLFSRVLQNEVPVRQIHFGGGSPSYLSPYQIETVAAALHESFPIAADAEVSVELDPRTTTREKVETFRAAGFNRASVGVQDLDRDVQEAIGRVQSLEETTDVLSWLRSTGFDSVNLDLIYGLPGQTVASVRRTVDSVLQLEPDRLALFSFAYVPTVKRHQAALDEAELPRGKSKLDLFEEIAGRLLTAGYAFIGFDHFALQDDELAIAAREGRLHRNFQGYTTEPDLALLGFGASSISMLDRMYAQNAKSTGEYERLIDNGSLPVMKGVQLSDDDVIRRFAISSIMCRLRLGYREFEQGTGARFIETFPEFERQVESLVADGLVLVDSEGITVTEKGQFFLRNIASVFDARSVSQAGRFSQTV